MCDFYINKKCTNEIAVVEKQYGENPSKGICKQCSLNTTKGVWPEVPTSLGWKVSRKLPKDRPKYLDCLNRSTSFRLVGCSTCGGHVSLKIYDCSIHLQCALRTTTGLIKSCSKCVDVRLKDTK